MKKKLIALTLIVCLIAVMGLTGCGSKPYSQYDLSEYVKVGNYKGLEMEKISVSVSDEEVTAKVQSNVEDSKTTEKKKEGTVAKGDKVNIDYEGKIDGKVFEGGSKKGDDLTIGSGQFIPGFEDGLIGKEIGSTQDLNLKFPDDYQNTDVAGKAVVFTVKINYVSVDTIPEYNDAWVAKNSKVKTTAEYEKQVKEQLLKDKEEEEKNTRKNDLWQEVFDSSEVIKYPEEEVNEYVKVLEEQYQKMAKTYSMELKDIWQQMGIQSEEEYNEKNKQAAQEYVKEQMVSYYIADKEKLSYTKDDEKKLRSQIEESGYTEDTFKENFGEDIDSYVELSLTYEKVIDFIYDNAKTVDKKTETKATKESTEETKATDSTDATTEGKGADDATSNDEPGGADA
ncbi:trigger factor [Anaerovorax odorimutans]|uniref:peptidylprolyl isomerase n=1 Tax=Anaerovorax odorimutans TaxID=109327 RepID=A0ABT1RS96_9FIRM|nr:trigger factor [Anaerovorax odorimutans]MCQ4638073.1 trigger factor [Anaerovorax odorimutans]